MVFIKIGKGISVYLDLKSNLWFLCPSHSICCFFFCRTILQVPTIHIDGRFSHFWCLLVSPAARNIWEGFARDHITNAADMRVSFMHCTYCVFTGHGGSLSARMQPLQRCQLSVWLCLQPPAVRIKCLLTSCFTPKSCSTTTFCISCQTIIRSGEALCTSHWENLMKCK